ncbi:Serine/threonine-protein phosphatase [Chaetomidium leptoderma]|uniref:Serine/threonine-protein phosphatase n=1 Tax=Chaetomidium leptoderma TaxID=669021 RepID=A0AAN6ZZE4_9PEZI|nr:Serine/threonine-protein phosphatase [Chaetomidium leptoderma]
MPSTMGMDGRRTRLQRLAAEWGVHTPPPVSPPTPAPQSRTPNDDFHAEELLKRRRLLANQESKNSQGSLKRAFSSVKKTWESNEIFEALDAHVANGGAPGVADALIAKLLGVGGNLNVASVKNRTNLLTRRRSIESMERSRVLQKAIQNRQIDMVAILAQHADPLTLDAALPLAIRSGDLVMVNLLLSRGANASQTQDAQDAFRQFCIVGGYHELIGLVLQSEGRPPPSWLSMSMVDAARQGCVQTVLKLSRASADGEYSRGEALKAAIAQCRVDIALAILTGPKPPTTGGQAVLESFTQLFEHTTIGPNEKMALTEALLCAGAAGDPVSMALSQACATDFYDMASLLVSYGASVEFQDASIIRHAISRGQSPLVQLLLSESSALSPIYASICVEHIPKTITPQERHVMLGLLLRKGAGGTSLHDALIDAAQAGDLQSAELLLTPHFPGAHPVPNQGLRSGTPGMGYVRHEMASVDHKNGAALGIAVKMGNLSMAKQLLGGKPSAQTLDHVFPLSLGLQSAARYHMAECFLAAGISRPCISAALQLAIEEQPPRRDENLISILLRHNADVNFNDGAGILSAITIRDLPLLEALLKSRPTPQTMAAAMARAMMVDDKAARYQMVRLLIGAGAGRDGTEVSEALVKLLATKPTDVQLAALLLEQGQADANFDQGLPVALAVDDPEPTVLELILQHGRPNPDTLYRGLETLSPTPTTPTKATKVDALLRRNPSPEMLNAILFKEVQTLLTLPAPQRHLAVLRSLLAAGADINAHKAAALSCAVKAADAPIVDLFFATTTTTTPPPSPASLAAALPQSLNILDPMDRLAFTTRLITAGAPAAEATRALVYAITAHPADLPLLALLAAHAEAGDGSALMAAVRGGNADVVGLVLEKGKGKHTPALLRDAFWEGVGVVVGAGQKKKAAARVGICAALLKRGVSGAVVSDALLAAARDGDLELGGVLMDHGASVDHQEGQAVVEACGAGSAAVLGMLLGSTKVEVKMGTLVKGFQAATQVGDLAKRADVFRLLLDKGGVSGEAVDAQLVSAAKFGEEGEKLVRLLLEFGASVDYNAGEAIWNATRGVIMGSLKLMIGVERVGERQKKPSTATLLRALKASRKLGREPRFHVTDWLFQAGLPACEEINIALNRAVKDEPDPRLVQLLLKHGASPLANGCETLTDAAQLLLVDILALLLELDIPSKDVSWAFQQAFTPETAITWLSEKGFRVSKMLLEKGAEGESLALALSTAIDSYGSDNDGIARRFAAVLLQSNVDANYEDGLVLQKAARKADSELIQQVLQRKPGSHAVSMAFPYIFDADLSEADTLLLVELFIDYHDGEERLDVMFTHPQAEPVMFRAISKFPRSTKILQTLLDAGYYHDQTTAMRVMEDVEGEEEASLLLWALFQPQKRVSSTVIELLIDRGAKVDFETRLSKTTPLMLAIQNRRHDLVKTLILSGAEVDVMDATGNTPMTMATQIGGDLSTSIMSSILAADPSINDGSLHNAARDLNLKAMQVLVEYGHDVDFPSTLHGGRSALGELCLNAAHAGALTAAQEKQMEKAMSFLINKDSDLTIQSDGKSVLLLALNSADPIPTTRAFLKVGLWKHINRPYNHYTDGVYTYSATQYITRVLPCPDDARPQLLELLKSNRATDAYYANDGPQPEDAINLPADLLRAERERRAREERISKETEEHTLALARTKEIAQIHNQIFRARAELEDSRARRKQEDEITALHERQAAEESAFAAQLQRRKAEREAAVAHEQRLTEAGLTRARLVSDAELEMQSKKQQMMIQWEGNMSRQREGDAKALSGVRIREREAVERLDAAADARTVKRIAEQKKLVEGQTALAARLANGAGGVDRRQIGYVTGELD